MSRTLSEIKERKKCYFARQVEASDKGRVEATNVAEDDSHYSVEPPEATVDVLTSCVPADVK